MLLLEGLTPKHLDRPLVAGWIEIPAWRHQFGVMVTCLFMQAVGCQAAMWVKTVRGLNKED